ncbi:5-(carboxyamino)imidazole ribonucleotide synthase [Caldisalinibacter kiritimatiensis]|uniref:N5-carboxyaminoimidazole ribonucleotide synthase n=1 Tax=Caldisalinibacter kiritimatiensis TaxID=1304284 RepID=R1AU17_9FIRM|nr:5-(carboxyamino)imidazole ribonucleotide synthase [Caldisalinibacter kiritimatiensis]EOD00162.1 Phosphoribosylaminoimidazole carboxylase ATPase subunit [Caldisalinibacter kiritimatiensis]
MNLNDIRVGIIGGGQLGKMLIQEAKKMDFYVCVLTPSADSPAAKIADEIIVGDLYDEDKISDIVRKCDVTTYEIEHINTDILCSLEEEGHKIYPYPKILKTINNKYVQKEFLRKNNLPTSEFEKISDLNDIASKFGFPFVQKACVGGYDGRGVKVIKSEKDFNSALECDSFAEKYVEFEKEFSVIVSRGINGEVKVFPVVEMMFDENKNICDKIISPGRIERYITEQAQEIAINCIELLNGVGVFAIEMFLTKDKKVLINEIAPRVHNSGHHTIESCITSQFEQHIRAICNLPLGGADLIIPSVMVNILGEEGEYGHPFYKGLEDVMKISGVNVHIYGKKTIKPFRKMGHITVVDNDIEKALGKAMKVNKMLRAISLEGDNHEE